LRAHADSVEAQRQLGVQLLDGGRALPLPGVMMQVTPDDHGAKGANIGSRHVVVLGRFALGEQRSGLQLGLSLFGKAADEQAQEITISRGDQARRLLLTPARSQGQLLPSDWATLTDYAAQGIGHVLAGPDHLLFLLVVLAAGWGLRQVLLANWRR